MKSLEFTHQEMKETKKEAMEAKKETEKLKGEVEDLRDIIKQQQSKIEKLEIDQRRQNLKLYGVPERGTGGKPGKLLVKETMKIDKPLQLL